jgi:hypothetical protein
MTRSTPVNSGVLKEEKAEKEILVMATIFASRTSRGNFGSETYLINEKAL